MTSKKEMTIEEMKLDVQKVFDVLGEKDALESTAIIGAVFGICLSQLTEHIAQYAINTLVAHEKAVRNARKNI